MIWQKRMVISRLLAKYQTQNIQNRIESFSEMAVDYRIMVEDKLGLAEKFGKNFEGT